MSYDYQELKVWQKAHAVTLDVYKLTKQWPREEIYGLTSQARRAALSIGANLAEGSGRMGPAEFAHFVSLAAGSAAELEYELLVARDLGYLEDDAHTPIANELTEIRKMLGALWSRLSASGSPLSAGAQRP